MDGLTEGRIVHYVLGKDYLTIGEHRPAIIVKVVNKEKGSINIQVFLDGPNDTSNPSRSLIGHDYWSFVPYSEEKEPGTWHWIEKA